MFRTIGLFTARRRSFSTFGSNSNNDNNVIDLWKKVLAGVHAPSASQEEHYFKDLVATGINLNKGRHQNLFPDEIVANFRSYYSTLDLANKNKLFHSLATVFSLDKSQIDAAVEHWHAVQSRENKDNKNTTTDSTPAPTATTSLPNLSSDEASLRAAERLYQSTQPLYSRLWTPLAQQHHDGLSFLIDLRADLLESISKHPAGAGPLRIMSEGLRRTLAGWFNVGLLQLERVTWENTSAAMLEKIASEEKVHSIDNWNVLKSRVGSKRRVFAWTHPLLPGEPLVALHVALCSRVTSTMDEILSKESSGRRDNKRNKKNRMIDDKEGEEEEEEEKIVSSKSEFVPTVAIFYSISNMKRGLSGVDLGNNLIKRAAKELMTELPSLKTLATLSPLPGFSSWVESTLTRISVDHTMGRKHEEPFLLLPEEKENLENILDKTLTQIETGAASGDDDAELLRHALSLFTSSSSSSTTYINIQNALKSPLLRLAAHYLLNEKHRGRALDSVANFHLRNGACVYRLNWLADTSSAGMERSYGIMVNYMYNMDAVEENNRKYIMNGEISVSEKF